MRTACPCQPNFFKPLFSHIMWGGWGSNPRPADYEKYGPMRHAR